jgi:lysozyme
VRPILYVNQRFVTHYLSEAPDLMENYLVWIARYGEYKPGVHLVMWQLSADGRVKGIRTDVDVNVFNGYEPQWEQFLKEETIK